MSALEHITLATLRLMHDTLVSRGNDSSYEHNQSDQLRAIDAELALRWADGRPLPLTEERRRDAEFARIVARARA
jgi:hypothetical protein